MGGLAGCESDLRSSYDLRSGGLAGCGYKGMATGSMVVDIAAGTLIKPDLSLSDYHNPVTSTSVYQ